MEERLSTPVREAKLVLEGLACSGCAARIEKAVRELAYVKEAELNFATGTIRIKGNNNEMKHILKAVQGISDQIEPGINVKNVNFTERTTHKPQKIRWGLVYGTGVFAFALIVSKTFLLGNSPMWVRLFLYGFSYILIGGTIVLNAVKNIIRGQIFDENFLMTIATVGAFSIGEYPEGVAVMLFYMIGEYFQERAVNRSRRSIQSLMDIRPDYANLKIGNKVEQVSPEKVKVGDLIIVKPGEKVPLDGLVTEGKSFVDTSALTGESVPGIVKVGDVILAGTINKDGLLIIEVRKPFGESAVAKILDLVENAGNKKAQTEKFITKFARYYTPIIVFSALTLAIIPPLFIPGSDFSGWFYRALIFLVISCPCALVVSIPLGFFGGIGRASREGILIKGGNFLEALNHVKVIVFDKTGTVTRGVFKVQRVQPVHNFNRDELLRLAAMAESYSNHPIARSIVEAYQGKIISEEIEAYQEISGEGVKVKTAGKEILVGNHKLMERGKVTFTPVEDEGTIVYISVDGQYSGYITISDEIKPDVLETIKNLKSLGIQKLMMLTGDRDKVAKTVAAQSGLDEYYAELLPDKKVEMIEKILAGIDNSGKLLFVGDGINDAPVLARADIGVAMGGLGSDAAIEAADVVLMTDEPHKIVTAIHIARNTRKIVWENIIMALGIKGIVLLLGVLGFATMWYAVFADVGVALLAVLNTMRIMRM